MANLDLVTQMREQRHESRAQQTYRRFLAHLEELSHLPAQEAQEAAKHVLCLLEQRITAGEADDLNAQLPIKLRELVQRCDKHTTLKPRKIDRQEFLGIICEDLGKSDAAAVEPIVRAVFQAVRDQVSEGEAEQVAGQLPSDLRDLWYLGA